MKYRFRANTNCFQCGSSFLFNYFGNQYESVCPKCQNKVYEEITGAMVAVEVAAEKVAYEGKLTPYEIYQIASKSLKFLTDQGYIRERGFGELTQTELDIMKKATTTSGFDINLKESPSVALIVVGLY